MTQKQYKITLLLGIIGAVLTIFGDYLIGANPAGRSAITTGSPMLDAFADSTAGSDLRLVLGGMLGLIGLPMEGAAYFGMGKLLLKDRKGVMPHLSCAVIALLMKWIAPADPNLAVDVVLKYTYCILTPMTVFFGVLLFIALLYQFILIVRGSTPYPRYAAFYNMALGAGVFMLIGAVIGNNTIGNGISTAAVSMGTL